MFDYLAMSYKDFDYTIVIAVVCWPKRMNFGAETHLGGGVMSPFCLPVDRYCSSAHFDIHWQYSSQERPMKTLTTLT